jgi:hypothetical protein
MPAGTPRERFDRATMAAYATYRPEWAAAQQLPTLQEAKAAAWAAELKRAGAVQAAVQRYCDELSQVTAS